MSEVKDLAASSLWHDTASFEFRDVEVGDSVITEVFESAVTRWTVAGPVWVAIAGGWKGVDEDGNPQIYHRVDRTRSAEQLAAIGCSQQFDWKGELVTPENPLVLWERTS